MCSSDLGGLPIPPPPGARIEDVTEAILAPIEARLAAPVATREAYLEAWKAHPAFTEITGDLREYIDYDLIEREGALWPSGSLEAIRADGRTLIGDADLSAALAAAPGSVPREFLRAEFGMAVGAPPLYPPDEAASLAQRFALPARTVEGVNHYTIVMGEEGARGVLAALGRVGS